MAPVSYSKPDTPADWDALREICCLTADEGRGIARPEWDFFAEYWVGPYQKFAPEWAYTALDEGRVIGYLTGAPGSLSFCLRRALFHRIPLWKDVRRGRYPGSPQAEGKLKRALGFAANPEHRLALSILGGMMTIYPAHLHVNVLESHRGQGVGKRLLELFVRDLRERRVPGLHLVCGEKPMGFYKHLGFAELAKTRSQAGATIYALGMILA